MSTLDLTGATTGFDMTNPNLLKFGSVVGAPTSTTWTYASTAGNRVTVSGTGMQFDASGNPIAGTVTSLAIDVANNGSIDLVLNGLNAAASPLGSILRSSPAEFWRTVLGGGDVIYGPETKDGSFSGIYVVGDGMSSRAGDTTGGHDIIQLGGGSAYVRGDMENVGSPIVGAAPSTFHGGNDDIAGVVTDESQAVTGDAVRVYGGSTLDGGDDVILLQSTHFDASVSGDAGDAVGRVIGGNDYITGGKDFQGDLVGDVDEAHPGSVVTGGNDTINGGDLNEILVGDVFKLRGGRLDGGNDTINGGGGNDRIIGDAWEVRADSTGTGGQDIIRGGGSNDDIYGDFAEGGVNVVGGNDRLYGDDGSDMLHGEGGDDTLDGGSGADIVYGGDGDDWVSGGADSDMLYGGAGNDMLDGGAGADSQFGMQGDDIYFVNNASDTTSEEANQGVDTVWSTLSAMTLSANVENLRYNGVGAFSGTGNGLANVIEGSSGADRLDGAAGNDQLIGGAGGDALIGGEGSDTASYVTAANGVAAQLLAPGANTGDAAGDSYVGVENLTGSQFGDILTGGNDGNTLAGQSGSDVLSGLLGNDTLRGGAQADILIGDAGSDVFDFDATTNSTAGARDVIRAGLVAAFEGAGAAAGDLIDLSGIDANTAAAGNQAFIFGGTGVGRVSLVTSGTDTLVHANVDNDAAFEFELLIEDGGVQPAAYRAADFIL